MVRVSWIVIALLVFAGPLAARNASVGSEAGSLSDELASLRKELALTKLKLQTAMGELERLKAFLSEKNLDERLAEWQAERRLLTEERLRVQRERNRLELARRQLGQTATLKVQRDAEARAQAEQKHREALKPKWSIQYMLGYIDNDRETYYTRVINGRIYSRRTLGTNIDTHNVKVKGTVLNRSEAPWRYTFEIRLGGEGQNPADRQAVPLGRWRIQTPLLGPGDLHEFEIVIPVRNAYSVETVQIGQITADRPARIVPVPAPQATPPASPSTSAQGKTIEAYAP